MVHPHDAPVADFTVMCTGWLHTLAAILTALHELVFEVAEEFWWHIVLFLGILAQAETFQPWLFSLNKRLFVLGQLICCFAERLGLH